VIRDTYATYPGGGEASKGLAVRQLKSYASWVRIPEPSEFSSRINNKKNSKLTHNGEVRLRMIKLYVMDDIVGRLQSAFPLHQLDVILGSLLGDARLECRSKGVRAKHTARLRVHHGYKQKEYVWWKYKILKDYVSCQPREISWTNEKRNLFEVSWYFHTKSLENLGIIHKIFYENGVKKFPTNILPIFSDRMLAVWYMDDGSNNHGSVTLNTHSFSLEDQQIIVDLLKRKYHIYPTIVKDRLQWKISIGSYDYDHFLSIVAPFIPQVMAYKIANPRNDLSIKLGRASASADANTSVPDMENLEKV